MKSVLTGFKYIGGEILELEQKGEQDKFVFGFEESCGYLKGTYARDKDAVVASMLVCEMAASLKAQGKTILDALNERRRAADILNRRFARYLREPIRVEFNRDWESDMYNDTHNLDKIIEANDGKEVD